MAKSKEQKKQIIENLKEKVKKARSIIFVNFTGLTVKENEDLRTQLRNEDCEYFVAKKTLFNIALKDKKVESFDVKAFDGQVAAVFGYSDEVLPAKLVDGFKKNHAEKILFLGGILDEKYLELSEVEALAKIPTKQELLAKLVGSLNSSISGLVNVFAGNLRGLVTVLKAIEEKKS